MIYTVKTKKDLHRQKSQGFGREHSFYKHGCYFKSYVSS